MIFPRLLSVLLAPLATTAFASLRAQDEVPLPPFRIDLGFGGGQLEHRTRGSDLDGDADAGFFRFASEGIGPSGIGGGVRLEGIASDDDLFSDAGYAPAEASASSLFGHVTFRLGREDLVLPIRAGLQLHGYVLEEVGTGAETTFTSFGPQFEIAPELFFLRDDQVMWSAYVQFGLGFAATSVDVDAVGDDFDSASFFYDFELGTRVYVGHVHFGLGLLVRGQDVDESDVDNGVVVLGIENDFTGLLLSVGAIF